MKPVDITLKILSRILKEGITGIKKRKFPGNSW